MNIAWVATLSDGSTKAEHQDFKIEAGQRKPWVRFVQSLKEGEFLTSLRINVNGHTIHMPRLKPKFEGFQPSFYSLEYRVEVDDLLGEVNEKHYLQVGAHYENFWIRCIIDLTTGNNSWLEVVNESIAEAPLMPTPRRPLDNG